LIWVKFTGSLAYNSIDTEGLNALAMMLRKNTTLTSLNLGKILSLTLDENYIKDQALEPLATTLKTNTTLKALYLGKLEE